MLALVLTAVLAAQSPTLDDPAFTEGLRLLEDFEYEKATFRFREALRDETKTPAQMAVVHVYLGMTLAELREEAAAVDAFVDALRSDPAVVLPADASPKVRTLLEEARKKLAEAPAETPKADPTPTPPVDPTPAPTPTPTPEVTPEPVSEGGGGVIWLASGGVSAGLGAVALLGAGGLGYVAYDLFLQGEQAQFQEDAVALRDQSVSLQVAAAAVGGAGALLLAAGAGLMLVGVFE
jgi:hypothetical protein